MNFPFTDFGSDVRQKVASGATEETMRVVFHEWVEKFVRELSLWDKLYIPKFGKSLGQLFEVVPPEFYLVLAAALGGYLRNSAGFLRMFGWLGPSVATALTATGSGIYQYLSDRKTSGQPIELDEFQRRLNVHVITGSHPLSVSKNFITLIMSDASMFAALWWLVQFYKLRDGDEGDNEGKITGLDGYAFRLDEAYQKLAHECPTEFVALMQSRKITADEFEDALARNSIAPFEEIIPIILTATQSSWRASTLDWVDYAFNFGKLKREWREWRLLRFGQVFYAAMGAVLGLLASITLFGIPVILLASFIMAGAAFTGCLAVSPYLPH